jgi:hypothetical protein
LVRWPERSIVFQGPDDSGICTTGNADISQHQGFTLKKEKPCTWYEVECRFKEKRRCFELVDSQKTYAEKGSNSNQGNCPRLVRRLNADTATSPLLVVAEDLLSPTIITARVNE